MANSLDYLADNLERVRGRIASAAKQAGRSPDEVRLVAVTKYADAAAVRRLYELGQRDFGESRPQALWLKVEELTDLPDVRWHMIGHLQRNKVSRTLPLIHLLHSGDSSRLLAAVAAAAGELGRVQDVLLEVNISGDATKHGFHPSEAAEAVASLQNLTHVRPRGLMGMASRDGDLEAAARDFSALRKLRDTLQATHPTLDLAELSMGMSGDLEVAVAVGATLVRVGSDLCRPPEA